jgi:hypothetical protein
MKKRGKARLTVTAFGVGVRGWRLGWCLGANMDAGHLGKTAAGMNLHPPVFAL